MPKRLLFGKAAQAKLQEGIDELANAVRGILGPQRDQCLSIWASSQRVVDGSGVADRTMLKDPYANMGVLLGQDMARNIKNVSGDGTATGIILLNALVKEGLRHALSGVNPMVIKRGMEKALCHALKAIDELAIPVETNSIKGVATASASGNKEVGKIISHAFNQIGMSGVIVVEEGEGAETSIELVEGVQLDCGYASPYFCTDAKTMCVEMNQTALLMIDGTLSTLQDTLPLLEKIPFQMQPLLIIAKEIEGDALSTLVMNKLHGIMQIAAINLSDVHESQQAILQDIALLTGATIIYKGKGMSLHNATIDMIGQVEKLKIDKDKTIIIGHTYPKKAIQKSVAIIRLGAATKSEMGKKKQIFEKSIHAMRLARKSGCVPGGGVALMHASQLLDQMAFCPGEEVGRKIVARACRVPFTEILKSYGKKGASSLKKLLGQAESVDYNDLMSKIAKLGVPELFDPTKVVKNALQFAVSTAGIILSSEVLITDQVEEEE